MEHNFKKVFLVWWFEGFINLREVLGFDLTTRQFYFIFSLSKVVLRLTLERSSPVLGIEASQALLAYDPKFFEENA